MKPDIDLDHRVLAGLNTLGPDPERAARTRQRCRALLERRAAMAASPKRTANRRRARSIASTALRNAMAAGCGILCVVYVLALAFTTVGLQGISRLGELVTW